MVARSSMPALLLVVAAAAVSLMALQASAHPLDGVQVCWVSMMNSLEKMCSVFAARCGEIPSAAELMATAIHCCEQQCSHEYIVSACCGRAEKRSTYLQ